MIPARRAGSGACGEKGASRTAGGVSGGGCQAGGGEASARGQENGGALLQLGCKLAALTTDVLFRSRRFGRYLTDLSSDVFREIVLEVTMSALSIVHLTMHTTFCATLQNAVGFGCSKDVTNLP